MQYQTPQLGHYSCANNRKIFSYVFAISLNQPKYIKSLKTLLWVTLGYYGWEKERERERERERAFFSVQISDIKLWAGAVAHVWVV